MDATDTDAEQPTTDPVCGREMTVGMELLDTEYGGCVYPFCSEHCRMLFALHPERYVAEPTRDAPDDQLDRPVAEHGGEDVHEGRGHR